MDQTATQSDHRRLSVPGIAEVLSVTSRTVYSLIDKHKWQKEVGHRGRVWYFIPEEFIEEYVRNAQIDQARSQQSVHNASHVFTTHSQQNSPLVSRQQPEATVTFTNDQFVLILGDKDSRISELKELLAEKDTLIGDLRMKLDTAQNRVSRLEGEMSGKTDVIKQLEARLLEKDSTIKSKEETINAAQGMVMLLEQQRQPALEAKPAIPEQSEANQPWWKKIGF